jgi:hypothetical protein
MRNVSLLLLGLLTAGVCHAQVPIRPQGVAQRAPQPIVARQASATAVKQPVATAAEYPMPAPVAATPVGCRSCAGGGMYGGCGGGGSPGFVGGCCDYLPLRARGLWDSYCADRGCGSGCGRSCMLGGCCNKIPIGLYGATPLGCCAAGVGPRHGWECGGGCGGCGTRCGIAGYSKPSLWRWGVGGQACGPTLGGGCAEAGCSSCGTTHEAPTPATPHEAPAASPVSHPAPRSAYQYPPAAPRPIARGMAYPGIR